MGSCFSSCRGSKTKSQDERSDGRYSIAASFASHDGPQTPRHTPTRTPVSGHIDRPPPAFDDPNKSSSTSTRSNDDSSRSRCSWESASSSGGSGGSFEMRHPVTPTHMSPLGGGGLSPPSSGGGAFGRGCGGLDSVPVSSVPIFDRSSSSSDFEKQQQQQQQLPNSGDSSDDIGVPLFRPAAPVATTDDWNGDRSNEPSSRRPNNDWMLGDEIAMGLPDSENYGRGGGGHDPQLFLQQQNPQQQSNSLDGQQQWFALPRSVLSPLPPTQAIPPNSSSSSSSSSNGFSPSRMVQNKSGTLVFDDGVVCHNIAGRDSKNSSGGGDSYESSLSNSAVSARTPTLLSEDDDDDDDDYDDDDDAAPPHVIRDSADNSTATLGVGPGGGDNSGITRDPSWQSESSMADNASTRSNVSAETIAFAESRQVSPQPSLSFSADLDEVGVPRAHN